MIVGVLLLIVAAWGVLLRYTCRWRGRSAGAVSASVVDEVFHPSRRLVHEERERRLVLRDDPEPGAPPRVSVDLERGRVVMRIGTEHAARGAAGD